MASSDSKPNTAQKQPEEAKPEQKKPAAIGEDDEFEDFPVEGSFPFPRAVYPSAYPPFALPPTLHLPNPSARPFYAPL